MSITGSSTPQGTRRLRRGRISLTNQIYHVTASTVRREKVFLDFKCGRMLIESLRRESQSGRCETLCFMVMPDHLHWLVQILDGGSLSSCVRNVKSGAARQINQLRGTRTRIWQNGYFDHGLRSDEDVIATARYIIANPIRAGIVEEVGAYPLWDAVWV